MIGKLIPKYYIKDEIGYARSGKSFSFWKILYISEQLELIVPFHKEPMMRQINPFRDLQDGGTLLGKYWFADDTLIGKILQFIFQ